MVLKHPRGWLTALLNRITLYRARNQADNFFFGGLRLPARANAPPTPHHNHAIGHGKDMLQVVADDHHRLPGLF